MRKSLSFVFVSLTVLSLVLSACGGQATKPNLLKCQLLKPAPWFLRLQRLPLPMRGPG
jgi:hypothetical protein